MKRWIIRSFFIALLLLFMSGWATKDRVPEVNREPKGMLTHLT